jgi:hypothetical protein
MRFLIALGVAFLTMRVVLAGGLQDAGEGKGTIGILPEVSVLRPSDPFGSSCGQGIGFDSFGRGVQFAVTGNNRASRYSSPSCFALGVDFARKQLASSDTFRCKEVFAEGRAAALAAQGQNQSTTCYALGFKAGAADLRIGAREGDAATVGSECVAAYARAVREYRADLALTPPDSGAKIAACYSQGWFEAPLRY